MTGAICGGAVKEVSRAPERVAWCFRCRRRLEFWRLILTPVDLMSYYGPHAEIRCGGCNGLDTDLFPGYSREWVGG